MVKQSKTRRSILRGGAATGGMTLAGCLDRGEDETRSKTVPAWAFAVHGDILLEMAEGWSSPSGYTADASKQSNITRLLTNAMLSGHNLPAISLIRTAFFQSTVKKNGFQPVDDSVRQFSDQIYPIAKARNQLDGQYYAYPNDIAPIVMVYNRDVFESAGLSPEPESVEERVETWEDWKSVAQTVESETDAKMGMFSGLAGASLYGLVLLQQYGGMYYDDDGNLSLDQPANVRALEVLTSLQQYVRPIGGLVWRGQAQNAFRKGEVASVLLPAWALTIATGTFPDMNLGLVLPPKADDGLGVRAGNYGGSQASVPAMIAEHRNEPVRRFGEHWHLSERSVTAKLEQGVFPAIRRPEADIWQREFEGFGGQKAFLVARRSAQNMPPYFPTPDPGIGFTGQGSPIPDIVNRGRPVEAALEEAQNEALQTLPPESHRMDFSKYDFKSA